MFIPFSETGKMPRLKGSCFGKRQISKQLPLLPCSDFFQTTALAEGNALSNPSKAIVHAPRGIAQPTSVWWIQIFLLKGINLSQVRERGDMVSKWMIHCWRAPSWFAGVATIRQQQCQLVIALNALWKLSKLKRHCWEKLFIFKQDVCI